MCKSVQYVSSGWVCGYVQNVCEYVQYVYNLCKCVQYVYSEWNMYEYEQYV